MRETSIKGITFNSKKEVLAHAKEIMERNVEVILVGDDLEFMWELIIGNYPNPAAKKLHTANKITVRKSTVYYNQNALWIWVIDNDGKARDVSLYKSVDNLKWYDVDVDDNFIDFGKYKNRIVSDVIKDDVDYFKWLLEQNWLRDGLRNVIINELEITQTQPMDIDIDIDYEPPF